MNDQKELKELREEIDVLDRELVRSFCRRMDVVQEIAKCKQQTGKAVYDPARERALLAKVSELSGQEKEEFTRVLYQTVLSVSRAAQNRALFSDNPLTEKIRRSLEETPKIFPAHATVACQGTEGAYSQQAAERLFRLPSISYFNSFGDVFHAIDQGFCQYGVLPIENSTAGSVREVYDHMASHHFYITRAVRLKISHSLLAKPGASLDKITEIYSHPQAISQCSEFLAKNKQIKVHSCENTAIAAEMVSQSNRTDLAAICAPLCRDLYGLCELASDVQNFDNNYTRFLCISKQPEIYPGADRTSVQTTLPHTPGALGNLLARFAALDINVCKIESRPMPQREFEFMFYFDFETSVYSEKLFELLAELNTISADFRYLGTYSEVL